ncbi:hypothetical protein DOK78_002561 [Enterococcus sp. DIV2402]|uniref:Phage conserved hypothetical protein C-terminal domain-containing protein n=1 Tax=Candidatus Enterococcus lowellii TaxID=2230877 RepID=A0ABZ2SRY4_9ENTE|nr:conserved phage C-terminal domain-containing protein [Enterococcus sp. DIV2402]MBO0463322.1 conserved phage C-terminal domain-containing protein [Enterococcus sp. DIV2402]
MDSHPNYYAIIPANVRYDKKLIPNAKLLYGEITALCNEKGYCWASNDYFAKLYTVDKKTIKKWLKSLEDNGYIQRNYKYKAGSKEIAMRWVTISTQSREEKVPIPRNQKVPDNSIVINNTSNNVSNIDKLEYIPYKSVIDYLNNKTGKKYKITQKWKDLIKSRWNEGQRLNDFVKVIDIKSAQWLSSNEMNKYLRPQTLFGNKFDEYLNEYQAPVEQNNNEYQRTQEELRKVYGEQ